MKKTLIILLLVSTQGSFAQNIERYVDSISKKHFENKNNAGLSIGIIKNHKQNAFYYGGKYTNQLKDVDSTTLFEIGSVTKLYTTFILASLEYENKINRSDLLSKYLPNNITKDKDWASKVKLVDLATHTSGLPAFDSTKSLVQLDGFDENNPYGMFTKEFMFSILKETDTLDNYGKVKYSNFGIGILGLAMAESQKTKFSYLFENYIIKKLKLKSTYLNLTENNLTDVAIPHRKQESMPLIHLAELSPSGSIKTTMPDLLKFLKVHIQPEVDQEKLVQSLLANQLTNSEQKVGLGWGIHKIKDETVYFHNGGTYGSSSIVIIVPTKNTGVAILSNNSDEGQLTNYALKIVGELIN
ncbi:serine hydrolase domain-containing protein [Aquimarina brevivitae]|uniref:Beta-lactamase class C n=1 Tax=Aquimarina brevivitae TaxID=323412 RepID=A0A4Q7P183_9FLAO|nr:serine hydrolase [Aquimarina brevivitae]RZS93581.1 beta-lactamase class C [Aquimarina brevivitae]